MKNKTLYFYKNQIWHFTILFATLYYFYVNKIDHSGLIILGFNAYQWLVINIWIHIIHIGYVWICWRSELLWKSVSKSIGFENYFYGFIFLISLRFFTLVIPFVDYASLYKPNALSFIVSIIMFVPIIYTLYSVKKYFGFKRAVGIDHFDKKYRNIPFEKRGMFKWVSNSMYTFGLLLPLAVAVLTGSKIMFLVGIFTYVGGWLHYFATEKPDMNLIYN